MLNLNFLTLIIWILANERFFRNLADAVRRKGGVSGKLPCGAEEVHLRPPKT